MRVKNVGELRIDASAKGLDLLIKPENGKLTAEDVLSVQEYRFVVPYKLAYKLYEAVSGGRKFVQKLGKHYLYVRYLKPTQKEIDGKTVKMFDGVMIAIYNENPLRAKSTNIPHSTSIPQPDSQETIYNTSTTATENSPKPLFRFFVRGGAYLELKKIIKKSLSSVKHVVLKIDNETTLVKSADGLTVFYNDKYISINPNQIDAFKNILTDFTLSKRESDVIFGLPVNQDRAKEILRVLV